MLSPSGVRRDGAQVADEGRAAGEGKGEAETEAQTRQEEGQGAHTQGEGKQGQEGDWQGGQQE